MKELESLKINYVGYSVPETKDEVELEILGLELAVKCAEQRIALLKQGLKVSQMQPREQEQSEEKSKPESE